MIDQIRKFKYAQPFQAFGIELSSGAKLKVISPDHVAFDEAGPGRVAVFNADHTVDIIAGLHITRVGELEEAGR